jgi:plastocyanin
VLALPLTARSDGPGRIDMRDFAFTPAALAVVRGATVTWTNTDKVGHSVVFGTPGVRSAVLASGQAFSTRFDTAGSFTYVCGVHSYMSGRIDVR